MSTLFNLYYIIHTNNQKTKISPPKLKNKTIPIIPNPLKKKLVSIWMKDESAVFFRRRKRERQRDEKKYFRL